MRHKNKNPNKRERRVRRSKGTSAPKLINKKMSVVAVSVALSLGVAYPVFAAGENEEPVKSDSPFSIANLGGNTQTTASGNNPTTTSSTTGGSPGGVTIPNSDGGAKLPQSGVPNEDGVIPYNPSESVISNAQSCAERTAEIVKENTDIAIETAGTTFDVDDYWNKIRSGGCLVSINDSISLANQITSLSGGSISSIIMSQVKSKIEEASQKMIEKVLSKGCEVMLEASQNVYAPLSELVGKYDIYADPNYVGDTLLGMVDTGIDNAIYDFDKKVDEIGQDILERDKNRPNNGGSTGGGGTGPLVPDSGGNMGDSTGNTSIDEAQKTAAAQTVIDLAQSRNNFEYPLYYRYQRTYPDRFNDYRGYKHTHLHSLIPNRPQGSEIDAIQVNNASRRPSYDNNAACTYIAQISTINNEIRRIASENGVQDTSGTPVAPHNLPLGYQNQANAHIRSAISSGTECAQAPVAANTGSRTGNSSGSDVVAPIFGDIDYGSSSLSRTPAPAARSVPSTNGQSSALTAPSTNEATQYMQDKQEELSAAPAPAPAPAPSSNPFSKMKSFFN